MSNETAITPSMCVAASDAAQELGINLPASHAGAVIEAALSASPTTQPADVSDPLARIDYPDGEWMPRMWDLALSSSDHDEVGSALTLKAVATSHGYRASFVQQEVPDDMIAASPAAILAQVAPPAHALDDVVLVGRTMDEDGILNWYVRPVDGGARSVTPTPMAEALRDMLSGWRYIRQHHGDLPGVAWDRAQDAAEAALRSPQPQPDAALVEALEIIAAPRAAQPIGMGIPDLEWAMMGIDMHRRVAANALRTARQDGQTEGEG